MLWIPATGDRSKRRDDDPSVRDQPTKRISDGGMSERHHQLPYHPEQAAFIHVDPERPPRARSVGSYQWQSMIDYCLLSMIG